MGIKKRRNFFKLEKPRVQTIWRVLITVDMMKFFDVLVDLFHVFLLVLENVSSMIGFVKVVLIFSIKCDNMDFGDDDLFFMMFLLR